jgi:hypothetical protein
MTHQQLQPYNREVFLQHVGQLAELAGAGLSLPAITKSLDVIEAKLDPANAPMGWKVTPASKPRAYFNICNHQQIDLLAVLKDGGLIPQRYIDEPEFQPAFKLLDGLMADGADFNTESGLCKVWAYTAMAPLEELMTNPHLPQSVRQFEQTLRSLDLNSYFFLAADFEKNSMNVYFPWEPEQRTEQWLQKFSRAIGDVELSQTALKGILATSDDTIGIGITFNWKSDLPQRACFYNPSVDAQSPALCETTFALREKLRKELPALINDANFLYNWSIGRAGEFAKIEKDYSGDFWQHVAKVYGLDPEGVHAEL